VREVVIDLAEEYESSFDVDQISLKQVGRVLGRFRLQRLPRAGGDGGRKWRVTLDDLRRLTKTYGVTLPEILCPHGFNGPNGSHGTAPEPPDEALENEEERVWTQ